MNVSIDNQTVDVPDGATVLEAAHAVGIEIPTLCHAPGLEHSTSCMVCLVRDEASNRLIPSCTAQATEGMRVDTCSDAVLAARKAAVELLLSEHAGDCLAPCTRICPAGANIPGVLGHLSDGRHDLADAVCRETVPFPAITGRICPAPCERACRRCGLDGPVTIRLALRHGGDRKRFEPFRPDAPSSGRTVAVVGGGPAGLAAARQCLRFGHGVTVYEASPQLWGAIRKNVDTTLLSPDVLEKEERELRQIGVRIALNHQITADRISDFIAEGQAVILATGSEASPHVVVTGDGAGVFSARSATSGRPMVAKAFFSGTSAARQADAWLREHFDPTVSKRFDSRLRHITEDELRRFAASASAVSRRKPASETDAGFSSSEAAVQASRCLQCACLSADHCRLRDVADALGVSERRFRKGARRPFTRDAGHPDIVFEAGKCILCGLCVQVARRALEPLGMAFIGRGFEVRVGGPRSSPMRSALASTAAECAAICPTGALSLRESTT